MSTRTIEEFAARQPAAYHELIDIGINPQGKCVARVRVARGAMVEVDTNLVSFAKLAAAGVYVHNEAPARRKS